MRVGEVDCTEVNHMKAQFGLAEHVPIFFSHILAEKVSSAFSLHVTLLTCGVHQEEYPI